MPIALTSINHPGARQPVQPSLRGTQKYVGPFSGAGVVPKNANKTKPLKSYNEKSPPTMTFPRKWIDGENTFSSLSSVNSEGIYHTDSVENPYTSYNNGIDGLPHKKDHNRIRREKREKKAFELALIESKKVQFQMNDFEVEDDNKNNNSNNTSSSSTSLKTLLYRAHSVSENNRTDPVDMEFNNGKLDERSNSYIQSSPYGKSYGYDGLSFNDRGRKGDRERGRDDDNYNSYHANGYNNNDNKSIDNHENSNNEGSSSSSSSSSTNSNNNSSNSTNNSNKGAGHGSDLVELASLLTHIRK